MVLRKGRKDETDKLNQAVYSVFQALCTYSDTGFAVCVAYGAVRHSASCACEKHSADGKRRYFSAYG